MLGILTHRWEHETGLLLFEILENSICMYVCMTRFYVFFYNEDPNFKKVCRQKQLDLSNIS